MRLDLAALLPSLVAMAATAAGIYATRAGRKDTQRQQAVANALEQREQQHAEANDALAHAREDAAVAYQRLQEERAEVARLRQEREAEAARLRAEVRQLLDDRSTLLSLVSDETSRVALATSRQIEAAEADAP